MYNLSMMEWKLKKKHTLHRIYFYMQPVYKLRLYWDREKNDKVKRRSFVTMPSEISYANFCVDICFPSL